MTFTISLNLGGGAHFAAWDITASKLPVLDGVLSHYHLNNDNYHCMLEFSAELGKRLAINVM